MRIIDYIDDDGYKRRVSLPDDAPDTHANMGILVGPPNLAPLDLPPQHDLALNNELFDRGLLTAEDVQGRQEELSAALKRVLKLDILILQQLFKENNIE